MSSKKLIYENGRPKLVSLNYRSRKSSDQKYNRYRSSHKQEYLKFYHSAEWLHIREQVLLRDGSICQRCGMQATLVDHIIPSEDDWEDRLNLDNLQALCKDCHYFKTRREEAKRKGGIKEAMTIYIISGYPGCGKTTYVHFHITESDLIYDYDALMSALSGNPLHTFNLNINDYIVLFYEMLLRKLKAEQTFNNVWIIRTYPDEKLDSLLVNRNLKHLFIKCDVNVCRNYIIQQNRDLQNFEDVVKKIDLAKSAGKFDGYKIIDRGSD